MSTKTNELASLITINKEKYSFRAVRHNLSAEQLTRHIVKKGEGRLSGSGVPMCNTGTFTGRSPNDRFIVRNDMTANTIAWGSINKPFDSRQFDSLMRKLMASMQRQEVYVSDVGVCKAQEYRLKLRVISTTAYHNLFVRNMFIAEQAVNDFVPDITVLVDPSFNAVPQTDGTNNPHFIVVNMALGILCIGGTGYTGEVKKGVFTILNFMLPHNHAVLTMHCGANRSAGGPSALFFGLSGTGKTTLSSDPHRLLIGDDEHAWTDDGIFNLEGGCYAKVINISEAAEPMIWNAIKPNALLENTIADSAGKVDYADSSITENMRVSYPLHHLNSRELKPIAPHPSDIFFLSCDTFGVLPPLSLLTHSQALFYFKSGYTARIAGTEQGINEPIAIFSAGFGAPFLPLPIETYTRLLQQRIRHHGTRVWLVNTGWIGGPYGVGKRISLSYTRALLSAAMNDKLDLTAMQQHPVFGLAMPTSCPNVPTSILNPASDWANQTGYDRAAVKLNEMLIRTGSKAE